MPHRVVSVRCIDEEPSLFHALPRVGKRGVWSCPRRAGAHEVTRKPAPRRGGVELSGFAEQAIESETHDVGGVGERRGER